MPQNYSGSITLSLTWVKKTSLCSFIKNTYLEKDKKPSHPGIKSSSFVLYKSPMNKALQQDSWLLTNQYCFLYDKVHGVFYPLNKYGNHGY
jgi:hypothetical protein